MIQATVYQPKNLEDALSWLAEAPKGARCLAGGTDLMVVGHTGGPLPEAFVDIWKLDELRGISEEGDSLWLGALTTYTQMIREPLIRKHLPLLSEAARSVGAVAIQNRGTLGGNIVNASPAGDTLPVLLVHEAQLELASVRGRRLVPATSFYKGYKQLDLAPDEIVTRVCLPKRRPEEVHLWVKVGQRRAQAISKVMLAARAELAGGVISWAKLALGSVAPVPVRLGKVEALLSGEAPSEDLARRAGACAREEVSPISDVRSTVEYRRTVSGNLAARFVRQLIAH